MSGIYIKEMDMPETCRLCYLSEFDPGFYAYVCKPTGIRIDYDMAKVDRPKRICPLVPVPPHGDLIDRREAIIDANERAYDFWLSDDEVNATIQFLNEQTTIISAEEEKV